MDTPTSQDGVVYSWGDATEGATGHDGMDDQDGHILTPLPVEIKPAIKFLQVSCGLYHTIAMTDDGCVWTWGRGDNGRLGHGNSEKRLEPKRVEAFDSVKNRALAVAAGYHHSMVVTTRGSIYTWGSGWSGQLGTGDNKDLSVPTRVTKFSGLDSSDRPIFVAVAGGYHHSLALTNNGRIYAWGYGEHGQLGLGDKKRQSYPHSVDGFRSVAFTAISASEFHSVALTADGSAYAWGHNRQNQLGWTETENKDRPKPKLIDTPVKFISISAGNTHTHAVSSDGKLYRWGRPPLARQQAERPTEVQLSTGVSPNFVQVSARLNHSLALTKNGEVFSWGYNEQGQLGHGSNDNANNPSLVLLPPNIRCTMVAAGGNHSVVLASSGSSSAPSTPRKPLLSLETVHANSSPSSTPNSLSLPPVSPSLNSPYAAFPTPPPSDLSLPPASPRSNPSTYFTSHGASSVTGGSPPSTFSSESSSFESSSPPGTEVDRGTLMRQLDEVSRLEQELLFKYEGFVIRERQLLKEKEELLMREKELAAQKDSLFQRLRSVL